MRLAADPTADQEDQRQGDLRWPQGQGAGRGRRPRVVAADAPHAGPANRTNEL